MTHQAGTDDIIICRNVNKWFGDFRALRDVSFTVKTREVVVIIGPSGSGKSTLIRTINRLEEHQDGEIIVDGIPLNDSVRNIEAIRMETGMVFQQFNLFPHLTVLQNVCLAPMQVRKKKRQEAEARGHGTVGARRHPGAGAQVPRPTIRRPATARGHRPRTRHATQDHALRRAYLGARPGDDQGSVWT